MLAAYCVSIRTFSGWSGAIAGEATCYRVICSPLFNIPDAGTLSGHPPDLVHLEAAVQHVFSEKREHAVTFHASVTVDISTFRFSACQAC